MKHEARSETDSVPLAKEMVDTPGTGRKPSKRIVEFAIVAMVVDTDFETALGEPMPQFRRHAIRAFRDKVEGGAKTQSHFEFGKVFDAGQTFRRFHVMCEDEGEASLLRPTR